MGFSTLAEFYARHARLGYDKAKADLDFHDGMALRQQILDRLQRHPLSPVMQVFGSAARGEIFPGDIDVVVDLTGGHPAVAALGPDGVDKALRSLLGLGRYGGPYYGLLDQFALMRPWDGAPITLMCRNDTSQQWQVARNKRKLMAAIRQEGRPIAEVSLRFDDMPGAPLLDGSDDTVDVAVPFF